MQRRVKLVMQVVVLSGASLAVTLLAGALHLATAQSRTGGESQPASVGVRVIPCPLAQPVTEAMRRSSLEKHWRELERRLEKPLRTILTAESVSRDALASLDVRALERNKWTLTRYLVRLLRELQATDLAGAHDLLALEAYAEHSLRDAMWDGANGWDVVERVRSETLEILAALEKARANAASSRGIKMGLSFGLSPVDVAASLLEAAAKPEPYSVGSDCKQPRD